MVTWLRLRRGRATTSRSESYPLVRGLPPSLLIDPNQRQPLSQLRDRLTVPDLRCGFRLSQPSGGICDGGNATVGERCRHRATRGSDRRSRRSSSPTGGCVGNIKCLSARMGRSRTSRDCGGTAIGPRTTAIMLAAPPVGPLRDRRSTPQMEDRR